MNNDRFSYIISVYNEWRAIHPNCTNIAPTHNPDWERFYLSRGITHDEIDDCEFDLLTLTPISTDTSLPSAWNNIDELTSEIIGAAIEVHRILGPGLLEQCYERALIHELTLRGINCTSQQRVPILYKGIDLTADDDDAHALRYDILVENTVVVELKSVENLSRVHFKQAQTYCKLLNKHIGLLFNFNVYNLMKEGFGRVAVGEVQ